MLCLGLGSALADGTPTIDFFKHPQYRNIKISPTGEYLAVSVPTDQHSRLAIIKLANLSISTVFDLPDAVDINHFFWVNDHRVVYDTAKREFSVTGALERPRYSGLIYAGDADGGNARELHGYAKDSGLNGIHYDQVPYHLESAIANSKDSVLILAEDQQLSQDNTYTTYGWNIDRLNVNTSHREAVESPSYAEFDFLPDADGQIRYLVGYEHGQTTTMYRASNHEAWTTISKEPSLDQRSNALGFTADNSGVYLGTGQGVYLENLSTKERKQVSKAPDIDTDNVVMAADGHTPIGIEVEPDYPGIELFDPGEPTAQMIRRLEKTFKDSQIEVTSFTRDGKHAVVRVSSDVDPGQFFLVDMESNAVSPLLKAMPWINPDKMSQMEAIQIKARDGTLLHGYLTIPRGAPEHGLPMVVLVHGGPHGPRDSWGFDPEVQFLASKGYAVLQINYRGSGGYGHAFMTSGFKHWGTTMQDDVTDATLWAIKDGVADPERICIAGGSYGAYAAMMGVIREPDLYRCAFAYDGVYDLSLMFHSGDISQDEEGLNYLRDVLGTDQADLRSRSPVYNVDRIKARLFLAHGEDDERAPLAHFTELTAALDKSGKPYEKLLKPKEEHGFYNEKNNAELYDKVAAFLDKYIGAGAAAVATPAAPASPAQAAASPP